MSENIIWFEDLSREDVTTAGGKGANLVELVVGGQVEPDTYSLTKDGPRLLEARVGNKALKIVRGPEGQLPVEIALYLEDDSTKRAQRFGLHDFFERVARRERVDLRDASFHARVVIAVLTEAVSAGEIADVVEQLPKELRILFENRFASGDSTDPSGLWTADDAPRSPR